MCADGGEHVHRWALAIKFDSGIEDEQLAEVMARTSSICGALRTDRIDKGPEFILKPFDCRADENSAKLNLSRLGKPMPNTFVGLFNVRLRNECLNTPSFLSLEDARAKIEGRRRDFIGNRPTHRLAG